MNIIPINFKIDKKLPPYVDNYAKMNKNFLVCDKDIIINLNDGSVVDLSDYEYYELISDFLCVKYKSENGSIFKLYNSKMEIIAEGSLIYSWGSSDNIKNEIIHVEKDNNIILLDYNGNKIVEYPEEECCFYYHSIKRFIKYEDNVEYLTDINGVKKSEEYLKIDYDENCFHLCVARNKDGSWGVIDANGNEFLPFEYHYLKIVPSNLNEPFFIGERKNDHYSYDTFVINSKNQIICKIDGVFFKTKSTYPTIGHDRYDIVGSLTFLKDKMILDYTTCWTNSYDSKKQKDCYIIDNKELIELEPNIRYFDLEKFDEYGRVECFDMLENKKIIYHRHRDRERADVVYHNIYKLSNYLYEILFYVYRKRENSISKDYINLGCGYITDLSHIPDKPFLKKISRMRKFFCIQDMNDKFGLIDEKGITIIPCKYDNIYCSEYDRFLLYDKLEDKYYIACDI